MQSVQDKWRYLVVVKVTPGFFNVVPIFKNDGVGLKHVSKAEICNYMSIQGSGPFEVQNADLPILEVDWWHSSFLVLHPRSVVTYTGIRTKRGSSPIDIGGRLTIESIATLLLHNRAEWGEAIRQPSPTMMMRTQEQHQAARAAQQADRLSRLAKAQSRMQLISSATSRASTPAHDN
jgi:hypothetical protein